MTNQAEGEKPSPSLEEPGAHDWKWWPNFGFNACTRCGIVRRADGKNRPCRGIVKVGLRENGSSPS